MIIYSAKPYNQRLTTLNTHQWPTPVQRRHHSYAQEGFGEAATAKYVHFFAQTPYGECGGMFASPLSRPTTLRE